MNFIYSSYENITIPTTSVKFLSFDSIPKYCSYFIILTVKNNIKIIQFNHRPVIIS